MPVGTTFDRARNPFRIMLQLRRPGRLGFLILQGDGDGGPPPNGRRMFIIAAAAARGPEAQQSVSGHGPLFRSFTPGRDRSFRRPVDA